MEDPQIEHLRIFYQQKYCELLIKGTEGGRNKRGLSDTSNSRSMKQIDKTTQRPAGTVLPEKEE